jgi:hypothetical protein
LGDIIAGGQWLSRLVVFAQKQLYSLQEEQKLSVDVGAEGI